MTTELTKTVMTSVDTILGQYVGYTIAMSCLESVDEIMTMVCEEQDLTNAQKTVLLDAIIMQRKDFEDTDQIVKVACYQAVGLVPEDFEEKIKAYINDADHIVTGQEIYDTFVKPITH